MGKALREDEMRIEKSDFEGILKIFPDVHRDNRGLFTELWQLARYEDLWPGLTFVQDNFSVSKKGTLRGLHFQSRHPQGKLITVVSGEIFDVALDLREHSKTFGSVFSTNLSSEDLCQLYIPEGFAHGFLTLSDTACVFYRCTDFYHPEDEGAILFNDANLGIHWPDVGELTVSDKDRRAMSFFEWRKSTL